MHPDFDSLPVFPNLKAMFSRAAGVEPFVNLPTLPNGPLCKIEPPGGDPMMTEYVVMHRDMHGNGRYQRVFPVAAGCSDGPLTDPTADPPGR